MVHAARRAIDWVEQGLVPDAVVRAGIRRLCEQRLREIDAGHCERASAATEAFVTGMDASELAPVPHLANEQHYEVPADFFRHALGPHLKYSCAWWPDGTRTLEHAEALALAATCERAGLADGQRILELGCGWGSLTLWMAAHYRRSHVTAVSNSASQRTWIEAQVLERGLDNVTVITADMNRFIAPGRATTASCPSRCSNTCATGGPCSRAWRTGSSPAGASSCTCSVTGRRPTRSSTVAPPTG